MKDSVRGWRQIGIQQQMQTAGRHPLMPSQVEQDGNQDAKVLAKAYNEFVKDGLTKQERETIEKIDDLVKGADIVISKDGNSAIIAQEDGKSFRVQLPPHEVPAVKSRTL